LRFCFAYNKTFRGGIIKKTIAVAFLVCLVLPAGAKTLRDVYQSGSVTIQSDLVINSDSLPEDMVMSEPSDFAFLPDGSILVSDIDQNIIFMFSQDGEYEKTIGRKGQGPGELALPTILGVQKDYFMTWEIGNRRFSLFAHDGSFLRHHKFSETTYLMPDKIVALQDGGFLMEYTRWDRGDGNVQQVAVLQILSRDLEKGKVLLEHPLNINKFITPRDNLRMNVPQPFAPRVSWDLAAPDRVVLGTQEKYCLRILDLEGGERSSFSHDAPPVPVTAKEKEEFFEKINYQGIDKKEVMPILRRHAVFQDHKPFYTGILVDPEGNILVFPSKEEARETDIRFDAFTPEGKFIKRVEIRGAETGFHRLRFHDGKLWSISRDEEEEPVLVRHTWGE